MRKKKKKKDITSELKASFLKENLCTKTNYGPRNWKACLTAIFKTDLWKGHTNGSWKGIRCALCLGVKRLSCHSWISLGNCFLTMSPGNGGTESQGSSAFSASPRQLCASAAPGWCSYRPHKQTQGLNQCQAKRSTVPAMAMTPSGC